MEKEFNSVFLPSSELETVNILHEVNSRFVSRYRLCNLGIYNDILNNLEKADHSDILRVYSRWSPLPISDTEMNLGSDCFGLASTLQKELMREGIPSYIFPSSAENLQAHTAKEALNDVGSVGLAVEMGKFLMIADPSFPIIHPLILSESHPQVTYQDLYRQYSCSLNFRERKGSIKVDGSSIASFRLEELRQEQIKFIQKRYVAIRSVIQSVAFNGNGVKRGGLRISLLRNKILVETPGQRIIMQGSEWDNFDPVFVAGVLRVDPDHLHAQVSNIVRNIPNIRKLLVPELQQFIE